MHMGTTRAAEASAAGSSYGSPPCTWGQRRSKLVKAGRFTPMHMGTTSTAGSGQAPTVHPHAHGDNVKPSARMSIPTGSPPCTWGQRTSQTIDSRRCAVHPHAHGDNAKRTALCLRRGSPPCTWGQLSGANRLCRCRRFTPMHMGTTGACDTRSADASRFTPMHMGTTRSAGSHAVLRFTPMHMGTTLRSSIRLGACGSPPCTWGQHQHHVAFGGIATRCRPSKSTIRREPSPQVRTTNPCSLGEFQACRQPPSPQPLTAFSHSLSRSRAVKWPRNIPAFGSIIHRLRSPLSRAGTLLQNQHDHAAPP